MSDRHLPLSPFSLDPVRAAWCSLSRRLTFQALSRHHSFEVRCHSASKIHDSLRLLCKPQSYQAHIRRYGHLQLAVQGSSSLPLSPVTSSINRPSNNQASGERRADFSRAIDSALPPSQDRLSHWLSSQAVIEKHLAPEGSSQRIAEILRHGKPSSAATLGRDAQRSGPYTRVCKLAAAAATATQSHSLHRRSAISPSFTSNPCNGDAERHRHVAGILS